MLPPTGVSADGKRCNAFRLQKKPDYATFSREIRGRNALQRVSPANFPGKRSIIWLIQLSRCNACRLQKHIVSADNTFRLKRKMPSAEKKKICLKKEMTFSKEI